MQPPRILAVLAAVLFATPALRASDLQVRAGHPRLFYTADAIARLRRRIATDRDSATSWAAIRAAADGAVAHPGSAGREIEALAVAYRLTGDARYAGPIREFLLRDVARANWGEPDLLRRDPPWQAGLGLARSLYAAAVAFDTVHDTLAPGDRRKIADGIVRLGILPTLDDWVLGGRRIHALDTMGHNWWSACVFTAGIGAIAVFDEEPRAREWLRRISEGSVEWFGYGGSLIENKPATFDPAGGFYESVNYASFAMSEYLLFRLAWTNAFSAPPPAIPMLGRIGGFFVNVAYPNSGAMMTLNFGDGSIHADGSRPLALLWDLGFRSPSAAWYLRTARRMSYREGLDRSTPFGLVWFPSRAELASAPETPGLPPSAIYPEMGWAMLRSSWGGDATLLGVKSGYTWNHSHADAGSFILFHRGRNLIIDSGNSSYARPEYDAYYRQSVAHNVVLFDGEGENPEDTYFGSKFPGSVSHLVDTGGLKYVLADATGPTSRVFDRNYRQFLWVGDVILVIDDVEAFKPGRFEWLLHTAAPAVRHGLDLDVSAGGAAIRVRPLFPSEFPDGGLPADFPERMRLAENTGLADHDPDVKQPYYAFVPADLVRRTKFITAITLVDPARPAPRIERLCGRNAIGVRIVQPETTTEVYVNLLADGRVRHRNANNTIADWETDAYLLVVQRRAGGGSPKADGLRRGAETGGRSDAQAANRTALEPGADPGNRKMGTASRAGAGMARRLSATAGRTAAESDFGPRREECDGGVTDCDRIFVADGSYLRCNGTVILDSLSKVFATWSNRDGVMDVVLQGQPVLNVRLHAGQEPRQVRVNGETSSAPYDPVAKQVTISVAP